VRQFAAGERRGLRSGPRQPASGLRRARTTRPEPSRSYQGSVLGKDRPGLLAVTNRCSRHSLRRLRWSDQHGDRSGRRLGASDDRRCDSRTMSAGAHTARMTDVTSSRSHPRTEQSSRAAERDDGSGPARSRVVLRSHDSARRRAGLAVVGALIDSPFTDPILHVVLQFAPAFDEYLPQVCTSTCGVHDQRLSTNACSTLCTVVNTVCMLIPRTLSRQEH